MKSLHLGFITPDARPKYLSSKAVVIAVGGVYDHALQFLDEVVMPAIEEMAYSVEDFTGEGAAARAGPAIMTRAGLRQVRGVQRQLDQLRGKKVSAHELHKTAGKLAMSRRYSGDDAERAAREQERRAIQPSPATTERAAR